MAKNNRRIRLLTEHSKFSFHSYPTPCTDSDIIDYKIYHKKLFKMTEVTVII